MRVFLSLFLFSPLIDSVMYTLEYMYRPLLYVEMVSRSDTIRMIYVGI